MMILWPSSAELIAQARESTRLSSALRAETRILVDDCRASVAAAARTRQAIQTRRRSAPPRRFEAPDSPRAARV